VARDGMVTHTTVRQDMWTLRELTSMSRGQD
jgi:hypothetical protein